MELLKADVLSGLLGKIAMIFNVFTEMEPKQFALMVVMWAIGGLLIYLAIKKEMEPTLLLPMGFGTILVNLPLADMFGVASEAVSYTH